MFTNIYKAALKNERHKISMQVFRMIVCGVARAGKTTFWKRLAKLKGFRPNERSPSTPAFESHIISANTKKESDVNRESYRELQLKSQENVRDDKSTSAHLQSAMLFDLHLYEEDSDLKNEALTIYKRIIMTNEPKSVNNDLTQSTTTSESHSEDQISTTDVTASISVKSLSPVAFSGAAVMKQSDPVSMEIDNYFEKLNSLLTSGEKLPDIPLIKKLCTLADIGGQRAFLEMLPTVTIGKALYLLFFSYENFEKEIEETFQKKANPKEVFTGTKYKQMEVIMQSLICLSTTSKTSSGNVALLVGTHVDKVKPQYVDRINGIIQEKVKEFIKSDTLVYAEEKKLVLEVSIEPTSRLTHDPDHYQEVIMKLVENRLKCSESEELPASWYMFSIVLRRIQLAGHSVIQYSHCQQIASNLYIRPTQLEALLERMHKILGIVIYFPDVKQLKDIVICDPAVVYKSISELIFNSYDVTSHPKCSLMLKKWGLFMVKELKERCKEQRGCQLKLEKLMILLQHLGIIAPVDVITSAEADVLSLESENEDESIHSQYLIPCILDDAQLADLKVQIQEAQACCIVPLRIYFDCGFAPMGGFCYLFTKLISNNRGNGSGWQLLLPDVFEETSKNVYWRNKVMFQVDEKYIVTLLSTHEYYEIHIICSQSTQPFQLKGDGHRICKKVWNAVSTVLSKSINEPMRKYKTACECIVHHNDRNFDGHGMIFSHNPDDHKPLVTASCLQYKTRKEILKDEMQSLIVWFKVCYAGLIIYVSCGYSTIISLIWVTVICINQMLA